MKSRALPSASLNSMISECSLLVHINLTTALRPGVLFIKLLKSSLIDCWAPGATTSDTLRVTLTERRLLGACATQGRTSWAYVTQANTTFAFLRPSFFRSDTIALNDAHTTQSSLLTIVSCLLCRLSLPL
jgi:hypothetical protein